MVGMAVACFGFMFEFSNIKIFRFIMVVTIAAAAFYSVKASAQRPQIEGAVSGGTGLSFGPGDDGAVMLMSPGYMDIDIIYYNDEAPKTEWVIGLQAELVGTVSVGVVPQIHFTNAPSKLMVYGIIGAPFVFAPFVLLGVEAGFGMMWRLGQRVGLIGEIVSDFYFLGNDLQDDGALVKLNMNLGVRIHFK
jgi:hypothetical protein